MHQMSKYTVIEPLTADGSLDKGDVESSATEEHSVTSQNLEDAQASRVLQWMRSVATLLYKCLSLIFFSAKRCAEGTTRRLAESDIGESTDRLLGSCQTDNRGQEDAYERVFHQKIMCLESMQLPKVLTERYKSVHDPALVAVVDRAVNEIHACRASMDILKHAMEGKTDDIMEASTVLWAERIDQHKSIIQLNMNRLVDVLSRRKQDTLVQMVDATAQSAAESQSRQALIDLNKSMLSVSQSDPNRIPVDKNTVEKGTAWTPSPSEEDIKRHHKAIVKQAAGSQTALLA